MGSTGTDRLGAARGLSLTAVFRADRVGWFRVAGERVRDRLEARTAGLGTELGDRSALLPRRGGSEGWTGFICTGDSFGVVLGFRGGLDRTDLGRADGRAELTRFRVPLYAVVETEPSGYFCRRLPCGPQNQHRSLPLGDLSLQLAFRQVGRTLIPSICSYVSRPESHHVSNKMNSPQKATCRSFVATVAGVQSGAGVR